MPVPTGTPAPCRSVGSSPRSTSPTPASSRGAGGAEGGAYIVSSFARRDYPGVSRTTARCGSTTRTVTLTLSGSSRRTRPDDGLDGPDNISVSPYGGVILPRTARDPPPDRRDPTRRDLPARPQRPRRDGQERRVHRPGVQHRPPASCSPTSRAGFGFAITGPWRPKRQGRHRHRSWPPAAESLRARRAAMQQIDDQLWSGRETGGRPMIYGTPARFDERDEVLRAERHRAGRRPHRDGQPGDLDRGDWQKDWYIKPLLHKVYELLPLVEALRGASGDGGAALGRHRRDRGGGAAGTGRPGPGAARRSVLRPTVPSTACWQPRRRLNHHYRTAGGTGAPQPPGAVLLRTDFPRARGGNG